MAGLTIGALARAAGVNVETIRFYERQGLLHKPAKPDEGYRRYTIEAVKQVRFIKGAQRLGFSLKEIAELLVLGREGEISCSEMLDLAGRKIAQIELKIMTLEAMKASLVELAESCPGTGNLALCPIWERMACIEERKEVKEMAKRKVEVFTAGCPVCTDLVDLVKATACPDCEVTIYNLNQGQSVEEAKRYGVTAVPSVVVEGKLLERCKRAHPTEHGPRALDSLSAREFFLPIWEKGKFNPLPLHLFPGAQLLKFLGGQNELNKSESFFLLRGHYCFCLFHRLSEDGRYDEYPYQIFQFINLLGRYLGDHSEFTLSYPYRLGDPLLRPDGRIGHCRYNRSLCGSYPDAHTHQSRSGNFHYRYVRCNRRQVGFLGHGKIFLGPDYLKSFH